jgi:hypothetical protein
MSAPWTRPRLLGRRRDPFRAKASLRALRARRLQKLALSRPPLLRPQRRSLLVGARRGVWPRAGPRARRGSSGPRGQSFLPGLPQKRSDQGNLGPGGPTVLKFSREGPPGQFSPRPKESDPEAILHAFGADPQGLRALYFPLPKRDYPEQFPAPPEGARLALFPLFGLLTPALSLSSGNAGVNSQAGPVGFLQACLLA